jgi:hypothetical protein
MTTTTTTTVTLSAARKQLAQAYAKLDQHVSFRAPGSLGQKANYLRAGISTSKSRAVTNARRLVERMVELNVSRLTKLVLHSYSIEDSGFSSVYLRNGEVVLVIHSSMDRVELGEEREAQLARFLREARQEVQS